jgi:proline dehydrogenase
MRVRYLITMPWMKIFEFVTYLPIHIMENRYSGNYICGTIEQIKMKEISIESFNDTELAFAAKTDWQLKKAYYLFKIVNNNSIASIATLSANIGLKLHLPIKGIIKNTVFEHFCGGETIEESRLSSDKLAEYNVGSILDYSVEGKDSEEAFDNAVAETLKTIENAKGNSSVPYCVFKPTGIGSALLMEKIQLGKELDDRENDAFLKVKKRYEVLCKAAFDADVRLLIDAEDSWYQNTIDDLLYDLMAKYNKQRAIVFNTYQMYRWQSLGNIKIAHQLANEKGFILGAKLVRGAYMEAERERAEEMGYTDPICADKEATDASYDGALEYCVENLHNVELFSGSHNEHSNFYLTELMAKAELKRNDGRIYFAQLYGMSDNISFVLADAGYNVAKYLPYGPIKFVMPYLIRRASENTSVEGQSGRELIMLSKEMRRRKNK